MAEQVFPTKGNLINTKKSLDLAKVGFELLDRKRNIIVREMMLLIDRAADIQSKIDTCYAGAPAGEVEQRVRASAALLGLERVLQAARAVEVEDGLTIQYRSVMGVEIPLVSLDAEPVELSYGFMDTSALVDEAYIKFDRVKKLTAELAEVQADPLYSGDMGEHMEGYADFIEERMADAEASQRLEEYHFAPADLHGQIHHRLPGREGAGGFLPAQGDQSPEKRRPERVGSSRPKPPNTGAFCCISRSHHVY